MKLEEAIKIGDIHVSRMSYAMTELASSFPLKPQDLDPLPMQQLFLLELFTSRFSKLQDLMGNQIFPLFLERLGEFDPTMTMIDKLNRLEKIRVIDNAAEWRAMREIRNHLSHEYPEHPEIMTEYLNTAFQMGRKLLEVFEKIKNWK